MRPPHSNTPGADNPSADIPSADGSRADIPSAGLPATPDGHAPADPPADPPGLPLAALGGYLSDRGFEAPALSAELIAGGKSNLTYTVTTHTATGGGRTRVLRRPPLGHVLATAHDMGREYRVLSALAPTAVPVPEVYLLCADPEVIGAPFYLMELVEGTVYRDRAQTASLDAERARAISWALTDVLADLHAVDPEAVGLGDFGRPEGYLDRQVARWGIAMLGAVGAVAVHGTEEGRRHPAVALGYGTGLALIVDEFALLLDLKDVYWAQQGRISVDVGVGIVAAGGTLFAALPILQRLARNRGKAWEGRALHRAKH